MTTLRILIVDDNKALRDAVRRLLAFRPSWEICGEATNGREAIEKSVELHPDVVLMDIGMPEMDGLQATRRLGELAPEIEVLVFTEHESKHAMAAALDTSPNHALANWARPSKPLLNTSTTLPSAGKSRSTQTPEEHSQGFCR